MVAIGVPSFMVSPLDCNAPVDVAIYEALM
jgi:hypothetical protein